MVSDGRQCSASRDFLRNSIVTDPTVLIRFVLAMEFTEEASDSDAREGRQRLGSELARQTL